MEITITFTNVPKPQTRMLLAASVSGTMKKKITATIRELIDNMSLTEYRFQSKNMVVHKKQRVLSLETHDALLARNKLLSAKLEEIAKQLKAQMWQSYEPIVYVATFVSKLMKVVYAF